MIEVLADVLFYYSILVAMISVVSLPALIGFVVYSLAMCNRPVGG